MYAKELNTDQMYVIEAFSLQGQICFCFFVAPFVDFVERDGFTLLLILAV